MKQSAILFCAIPCLVLSGCSTLQSDVSYYTPDIPYAAPKSGLTYFLPQRWVTLTAKSEPANAAKAQQELTKAKTALATAKAEEKTAKAELDAATALVTRSDESRPGHNDLVKLKDIAEVKALVKTEASKKADQAVKDKQAALTSALQSPKSCNYTITVALTEHLPDPILQFVADPQHSILRNDKQVLKVNTNGLLSSANVEAEDATPAIITEIAGAIGAFGGGPGSVAVAAVDGAGGAADGSKPRIPCYSTQITKVFDPASEESIQAVRDSADWDRLNLDLHVDFLSPPIPGAVIYSPADPAARRPSLELAPSENPGLFYRTPVPVMLTITTANPAPNKEKLIGEFLRNSGDYSSVDCLAIAASTCDRVEGDCRNQVRDGEADRVCRSVPLRNGTNLSVRKDCLDPGISACRDKKGEIFEAYVDSFCSTDLDGLDGYGDVKEDLCHFLQESVEIEPVTLHSSVLMVPQAGPTSFIPFKSSAFVKTVNDVTFENGVLTGWTQDRPSEVLSIVSLPITVAKALISVPAELITLKVDYSTSEAALAAQQMAVINQQTQNNALVECLSRAGTDTDLAMACLPAAASE